MTKPKILLSFSKLSDGNFLKKANEFFASMDNNPSFVDPQPTLATGLALRDTYSKDLAAAGQLGRTNVANKDNSREQLEEYFYALGL